MDETIDLLDLLKELDNATGGDNDDDDDVTITPVIREPQKYQCFLDRDELYGTYIDGEDAKEAIRKKAPIIVDLRDGSEHKIYNLKVRTGLFSYTQFMNFYKQCVRDLYDEERMMRDMGDWER